MARPHTTTNAPIWPYHGSLLREMSIVTLRLSEPRTHYQTQTTNHQPRTSVDSARRRRPAPGRDRRRRRCLRVVRRRADREADQVTLRGLIDLAVEDVDRLL